MAESIDDLDDPRIAGFRSLRVRTERGEAVPVGDGIRVLQTLIALEVPLHSVLVSTDALSAVEALLRSAAGVESPPVFTAPTALLSEVIGFRYHGGVMCAIDPPAEASELAALGPRVVALAGLEKGENLGAIARSALGFGATGLLLDASGAHPYQRSSIRASRGCIFGLAIRRSDDLVGDLRTLGERGHRRIGTVPRGGISLGEVFPEESGSVALVLGGEGQGASDAVRAECDEEVTIPLHAPVESLNVAATAALVLHALDNVGWAGGEGRAGREAAP